MNSPSFTASRLRVALLPEVIAPDPVGVCAVVDVIRASTTLVELAGSGDPEVWLAADHAAARAAAPRLGSGVLLGGEQGGLRPEGYDFGNSPREVAAGAYAGRRAIFVTTNGTNALRRWSTARRTFVGTLRNRDAVARRLVEEARAGGSMTVVCAGKEGTLALDDVYTAGVIVARILELRPDVEVDETAIVALRVAQAQPNVAAALAESQSAQALVAVGLWDDVPYCAVLDASSAVPELGGSGRLRLLKDG
ncbi:MAG: 2-phosphosulfolactate phosphatase [Chloroflexi bacterium]|nr:2-phosphosulfolactate phosphatase [Chloroflexota bacterium]